MGEIDLCPYCGSLPCDQTARPQPSGGQDGGGATDAEIRKALLRLMEHDIAQKDPNDYFTKRDLERAQQLAADPDAPEWQDGYKAARMFLSALSPSEQPEPVACTACLDTWGECNTCGGAHKNDPRWLQAQPSKQTGASEALSGLLAFTGLLTVDQMAKALIEVHGDEIGLSREALADKIDKAQAAAWSVLAALSTNEAG